MFGNKFKAGSGIFVKICGITNEADAHVAIEAGASALGFNLVKKSKRYIDIDSATAWIDKLPRKVCKVAIMANPSWEEAQRISKLSFIDALQLHGSESPRFCQQLSAAGVCFAKAIPVANSRSLTDLPDFSTDTVILDSASGGQFGGMGKAFPWELAREFAQKNPNVKMILAGGLNPENVAAAIEQARPFGVDVTTGVEASPGRKDTRLVKAFVNAVRHASGRAGEGVFGAPT
jgi:phosphoribosylanthranilate isomerase